MRDELSDREKQVAAHLAAGLRVAGVAKELCISEVTVRNHLRSIFSKLDVHSQNELVELLRRSPEILGAHRVIGSLETPSLVEDLGEADESIAERIEAAFAESNGLEALKAVMRAVLPLDETRRREWRARLAAHAVADQQREVREALEATRRNWAQRPLSRIASLQESGWVRTDLDADEVRRRLAERIYAAAVGLLADPSPEEERRQLAMMDELLESLAAKKP